MEEQIQTIVEQLIIATKNNRVLWCNSDEKYICYDLERQTLCEISHVELNKIRMFQGDVITLDCDMADRLYNSIKESLYNKQQANVSSFEETLKCINKKR